MTLEELSERSGIEQRTLRSWVSEGLLSPPIRLGRGARYSARNAYRAIAVRVLKDVHGLSMSEIGRRFMMATEDQIRAWAAETGPASAPRGSAREYLKKVRSRGAATGPDREPFDDSETVSGLSAGTKAPRRKTRGQHSRRAGRNTDLARIERMILHLEAALKDRAPRRSRGTVWTRISVTPDIEISIRGKLDSHEQALFDRLADQIRAILTGGTEYD